jgi:hypothetical protein
MENILNTRRKRMYFYILSIALLLLFLVVRYSVLKSQNSIDTSSEFIIISGKIIESFFVSLLTTVGLTFLYFNITPNDDKRIIKLVSKTYRIEKEFHKARKNADYWRFNGGVGRYTRTKTLPELYKIAKKKKEKIDIKIVIMDPNKKELCEKYANYKRSFDSENKFNWTKESTRVNLYATILKSAQYENQSNFLNIEIYIKNHFSLMRTELTQNKVIITKEDPSIPVVSLKKKSYLYSPYKEDFNQAIIQSEFVEITKDSNLNKSIEEISFTDAKTFFSNLSIAPPADDEIKEVLIILKNDFNPFPSSFKSLIS